MSATLSHFTEPSTMRGLVWTIGAALALFWIGHGDFKGALEVLTQAALVAGAIGVVTREGKPVCACQDDPGGEDGT